MRRQPSTSQSNFRLEQKETKETKNATHLIYRHIYQYHFVRVILSPSLVCSFYMRVEEVESALDRVVTILAAKPVAGAGVDVHLMGDARFPEGLLQLVRLLHADVSVRIAVQDQDRRQTGQVEVFPFGQPAVVSPPRRKPADPAPPPTTRPTIPATRPTSPIRFGSTSGRRAAKLIASLTVRVQAEKDRAFFWPFLGSGLRRPK